MGDVDDVEVYAAQPIYEFMQTPKGQWVDQHCSDLYWQVIANPYSYGHTVIVRGSISDKHATEYYLKWPSES